MSLRSALPYPISPVRIPSEPLRLGQAIIREEAQALEALAARLSSSFERAVELISHCRGCVIITGMGKAVWGMIEADLKEAGVTDMTEQYGPRLVEQERCSYLRPMVVHCESPENEIAKKEYMFPFTTVVQCPEDQMLAKIGPTLVCTGITNNEKLIHGLSDATYIDRLNIGPIPTSKLNWLQPHEGNIVDFLYRGRAFQMA